MTFHDYRKDGYSPEKIFSGFCRIVEGLVEKGFQQKELIRLYNQMPVILFDSNKAQRVLDWEKNYNPEYICLPFHSCIVVDPIGVVAFENAQVLTAEEGKKVNPQLFSQFKYEDNILNELIYTKITVYLHAMNKESANTISFLHASMSYATAEIELKPLELYVDKNNAFASDGDRIIRIPEEFNQNYFKDVGVSVGIAQAQLQYLTQPGQYVIQETSHHMRHSASPKIRRLLDRPRIVILDPEEMKKIYVGTGSGSHASPLPHVRMGHWRELRSGRFSHKQGQKIWIDEMRIKTGEKWEVKGKIYKVMERGGQFRSENA